MRSNIKTSKSSRIFSLGRAVAKASASYVYEKVRDSKDDLEKIQAAKEIIQSMGELKGGWMKIGQMLSITENAILPKEVTNLFKNLQKNSPALNYSAVARSFKSAYGKEPSEVFSYFEEKAMAAASIGQVHRARLKSGDWVAVKIQYPGIEEAIENDMKSAAKLDLLLSRLMQSKPDLDTLLAELKRCLKEECDYLKEADNTEFFAQSLREQFPQILVPKVYRDLSTDKILVTQLFEGESFEDSLNYDDEARDHLGMLLYESFLYCFFHLKKIHADPQNGNYLFSPQTMMWIDFGSVRSFDAEFVEDYCMLQYAAETKDIDLYVKAAKNLHVMQDGDSEDFIERHYKLVQKVYSPYTREGVYRAEYPNALGLIRDFIGDVKWKDRRPPKQEFVLLDRNNIGLFMKLKAWNPKINWVESRDRWRQPILNAAKKRYST